MNKVIVYVDDAEQARQILAPLSSRASAEKTQWVLVACAPRMTHRISKWVSHSARENWRTKWADKLFGQILPWLHAEGVPVSTVLAKGPLADLLTQLQAEHGAVPVIDARRPKQDEAVAAPAQVAQQPAAAPVNVTRKPSPRRWSLPGTLAGLGAMFMFVAE
ncbi:hypothetical protein [Acidovorax sp. NCPPB 3576]|uniref:hypothetical protein n=1 Tax=Acidovorax sp. NCPPB 3576 TaxID=2940488 RepID=UPI00234BC24D|nr:hypothetical protein [Acidovorax sp. NCPPB 3576]WCM88602.1 hypothetical protein M5C98_00640 [Acidovorax sp. NCPPB 3576]